MKRSVYLGALAALLAVVWAVNVVAQTAISADGVVESTSGGFKFPDGTVQGTAAASGSALVADTGQQTCYDPTGATTDEIPCAMTGQDGELQRGVDWPAPRFTDNGNGTVTDNLTSLIWSQEANCFGARSWTFALSDANTLSSNNQCGLLQDGSVAGDWKLPNLKELASLSDYGEDSPSIPSAAPFDMVQSTQYWTSTSYFPNPAQAWYVSMGDAVADASSKAELRFVWPVLRASAQ